LILAGGSAGAGDAAKPDRSFTITSDPSQVVISRTWVTGLTFDQGRYVIYGDGRFVHETRTYAGDLLGENEATLPFEELRAVVAIAVDHGLLDIDEAQLLRRLQALQQNDPRRARTTVSDGGTTVITISVAAYTLDGVSTGPVEQSFKLGPVKLLSELFPEIPELAGFAALTRRLEALALQAEQSREGSRP
jgi:hypothetical protein